MECPTGNLTWNCNTTSAPYFNQPLALIWRLLDAGGVSQIYSRISRFWTWSTYICVTFRHTWAKLDPLEWFKFPISIRSSWIWVTLKLFFIYQWSRCALKVMLSLLSWFHHNLWEMTIYNLSVCFSTCISFTHDTFGCLPTQWQWPQGGFQV